MKFDPRTLIGFGLVLLGGALTVANFPEVGQRVTEAGQALLFSGVVGVGLGAAALKLSPGIGEKK